MEKGSEVRKPDHKVDNIFLDRWSPRAMSGEAIDDEELMSLFEAARWAPSGSNKQPWKFIYVKRDTPEWDKMFNLLVEFNQMWAKNAAALVLVISQNSFEKDGEKKPHGSHSLDAGAAWMSAALQGSLNGLVIHGMAGFDYNKAREEYKIPEEYTVEMMFSVGKPGELSTIHERMQKSEHPSTRKTVSEFVKEGKF